MFVTLGVRDPLQWLNSSAFQKVICYFMLSACGWGSYLSVPAIYSCPLCALFYRRGARREIFQPGLGCCTWQRSLQLWRTGTIWNALSYACVDCVCVLTWSPLYIVSCVQLAHPVLDSLKSTERQWLVDLLFAFNSGNIGKFGELRSHWEKQVSYAAMWRGCHSLHRQRKTSVLVCFMFIAARFSITWSADEAEDLSLVPYGGGWPFEVVGWPARKLLPGVSESAFCYRWPSNDLPLTDNWHLRRSPKKHSCP